MTRRWRWGSVGHVVVVAAIVVWSVGPILVSLLTSLSSEADVNASPAVWWPHHFVTSAYRELLPFLGSHATAASGVVGQFGQAYRYSILVTLETVALALLISLPAGFAFSRMKVPAGRVLFGAIIATLALPVTALVAPLFRILVTMQLLNTNLGLVLIYTTAVTPLSVWLFYGYCNDMPIEPYEAALVDGCTSTAALIRVVIPQLRSGIAAVTAILFLTSWGQFLIPLLFGTSSNDRVLTVLISEFVGRNTTDYPLFAAAGILTLLPPAIVALVANRHIRGMLTGTK